MTGPTAAADFGEMRRLLRELPGPDAAADTAAAARQREIAGPGEALGRLAELTRWLAAWQGRHPPQLRRPRVAVFAGNHGIARPECGGPGVVDASGTTTERALQRVIAGEAAVNQVCAEADADLRAYEMALEAPTADFTAGPAMNEADCAGAMAYGMLAVEEGFDVMALAGIGAGSSLSAAALGCALFGDAPAAWLESGDGHEDARRRREEAVSTGLALHAHALDDPLEALRRFGGHEIAAIAGAVMACRLARTPVLLDGFAAAAAAAVLSRLDARAVDHCLVAHGPDGPGHARLLAALDKRPLLDLGIGAAGAGVGAGLALPLLKAACACHEGMGTAAANGPGAPV